MFEVLLEMGKLEEIKLGNKTYYSPTNKNDFFVIFERVDEAANTYFQFSPEDVNVAVKADIIKEIDEELTLQANKYYDLTDLDDVEELKIDLKASNNFDIEEGLLDWLNNAHIQL